MRKSLLLTYLKIILVIIVILIGVYYLYNFVLKKYNEKEFETVKTNMLLIQAKTELIQQKVEIKEKDAKYIGTQLKEKKDEPAIQNLINNKIIDLESKDSNYYCLDNNNLKELGLEEISVSNYYIVDYKKNDIIYLDGILNENGVVVYKLSEMK